MPNNRKPLVITAPQLGSILAKIAAGLGKQGDEEVFQVAYDSRQRDVQSNPALSVVITFDPKTFAAKTCTIMSAKKAAKEWNLTHGVTQKK